MSDRVLTWLVQLGLGGGLLLLLACLLMRAIADPARRQRLGEVGLLSALLVGLLALAPGWLRIPLPSWAEQGTQMAGLEPASPSLGESSPQENFQEPPSDLAVPLPGPAQPEEEITPEPVPEEPPDAVVLQPGTWPGSLENWLVVVYVGLAGLFLVRWLFAHAALAWLLRGAKPAPAGLTDLLAEMYPGRQPHLLVSPRVRVPFSFGLFRPTIVLPVCLVTAPPRILRWVLAHEHAHLHRRDGWAEVLLAVGQAVFFFVPWFWWLRRQVRLCQEYLADAAAVAAGGQREDYAEFLLGWAAAPAAPVPAHGAFGSSSDLYRRITMLLQPHPVEASTHPGRGAVVPAAVGLVALAVILAGMRLDVRGAAPPARADNPPKEAGKPRPEGKKGRLVVPPLPDIDKLLERLPPGTDEAQIKELRRRLEAMQKQIERQAAILQKQLDRQSDTIRKQMELHADAMRRQLELQRGLPFFGRKRGVLEARETRLGALLKAPEPALTEQLDLPKNQGLVVAEVGANSAAAKAGLKQHDILLELNGKPVSSRMEDFVKQLAEIKPMAKVDAVVMRKGKKETIKGLALPEAAQRGRPGRRGDTLFPGGIDKLIR